MKKQLKPTTQIQQKPKGLSEIAHDEEINHFQYKHKREKLTDKEKWELSSAIRQYPNKNHKPIWQPYGWLVQSDTPPASESNASNMASAATN